MIPYDFVYYRPDAAAEAFETFERESNLGLETHYYGGGTEIISMSRLYTYHPDAVIDLKAIPECNTFEVRDGKLILGAALTLSDITEANPWQLLSETAGRVADHTIRCKITLGGNIAAKIPYREAALPFLLAEADVVIAGKDRFRQAPFMEVFDGELQLEPNEFLVQLIVDERYTTMPFAHVKRTRLDWIDYPLVTVSALKVDGRLRFAFSGLCNFPFRSREVEESLNRPGSRLDERIDEALGRLPEPMQNDKQGSAEYREFVVRNTLRDVLIKLEG